jgi:carbon-monoxide dehydrogenase medium subunit
MKPPVFEYHRPDTVAESVEVLSRLGAGAKVLAGGQSLVPALNMRLATPSHVVDINRVADFPGIEVRDDAVLIGALVRQHEAEHSEALAQACPLIGQALEHVAHRAIRTRGTVVGSIVHGDPAAELPAVLVVLEGAVLAQGPGGTREIAAADFFSGYFETALAPDEVATAVRLRRMAPDEGSAFVEMARRHGDFALCGVAAVVSGATARVALTGVDAAPRAFDVSGLLRGDEAGLHELAASIDPQPDIHATVDYRRHLARVLTKRAVADAASRQQG